MQNSRGAKQEVAVSIMHPESITKKNVLLEEQEEEKVLFELGKKSSIKDVLYSYFRIPI